MNALREAEIAALQARAAWHRFKAGPEAAHAAQADVTQAEALEALAASLADPAGDALLAPLCAELAGLLHWLGEQDELDEYEALADRYRTSLDPAAMPDAATYLAALIRRARGAAGV